MPKTAYPVANDLRKRVLAVPPITQDMVTDIDFAQKIARARLDFEQATGRVFLAQTATRAFTPRGGYFLDLRADLAQLTSLTVGGTAKVLNTDFELWPENADSDGRPWTMIRFLNPYDPSLLSRRSIAVTGKWGFSVQIPDNAWDAMVDAGVWLCAPELSRSLGGGVRSWKLGESSEEYGDDPLGKMLMRCRSNAEDTAKDYTRTAGVYR